MTQPIELILLRQLASYLATPFFVIDAAGKLLYYNEAAEVLLGRRFEDTPDMGPADWLAAFRPHDLDGSFLSATENPLLAALTDGREHYRRLAIFGVDGTEHRISVTGLPLLGQAGRLLGAAAIFWPSEG